MKRNQSSIIKVIGVGGGGSNAVNHMFRSGITGVDFIVCNTDAQALESSPVPLRIQLGKNLTQGLGAGSVPEVGRKSAEETIDEIRAILEGNTRMVFITAGLGGGTGTGAAPVVAALASEMGLLSVGIVSLPFSFEGLRRKRQAEQGLEELRKYVDTLLVISNEKVRELHGNLKMTEAFGKADDILTTAAKGIAEIITVPGYINVDFEDINTVMKKSGVAIMGTGVASGENRAYKAVEMALQSPLLNDSEIRGANNVLLYITSGQDEVRMDELDEITSFIQQSAGDSTDITWGHSLDESLGEAISVTVIATGFKTKPGHNGSIPAKPDASRPIVHILDSEKQQDKPPVAVPAYERTNGSFSSETGIYDFEIKTNDPFRIMEAEQPFEFEVIKPTEPKIPEPETEPEAVVEMDVHLPVALTAPPTPASMDSGQNTRSENRVSRLREMSMKLKSPGGLQEYENQPAYVRKNVKLSETPGSSEPHVSRYTLDGEENTRNTDINSNNSYLHDNVD